MSYNSSFRAVLATTLCALAAGAWCQRGTAARQEKGVLANTDSLPMSTAFVGTYARNNPPSSFAWEGQTHDGTAIVGVLMRDIQNRSITRGKRRQAMMLLETLEYKLTGKGCIEELIVFYNEQAAQSEKNDVLACLSASEDPRALATFCEVLATEKDEVMRLFAASGLAKWNIRAGVEELQRLRDCELHLPGRRTRFVKDEADLVFIELNGPKGWGFPRTQVLKSIRQETTNRREIGAALTAAARIWFEENQHRFPVWNPGDPLPEAHKKTGRPTGD